VNLIHENRATAEIIEFGPARRGVRKTLE